MIGEVRAAGKSTQQLEKDTGRKLGDGYLKNPQITVTVKEYKSQKVFIMGEVKNPGTYPVTRENNLLFALSQAGGFTKDAGEEVVVIRPQDPSKQKMMTLEEAAAAKGTILRVNLKDALAGDRKNNISVRDGDSIIVPKMPFFFVMGEVQKPGQYNLERGTTVLMGISIGGGLTPKAAPNRTKIVREVEGKKTEIKVEHGDPGPAGGYDHRAGKLLLNSSKLSSKGIKDFLWKIFRKQPEINLAGLLAGAGQAPLDYSRLFSGLSGHRGYLFPDHDAHLPGHGPAHDREGQSQYPFHPGIDGH